ncbi:MAG TPA: ATP-dependent DNA helicase [Candidatus Limnocylindrales bacterium]|nr:ATP-dependent DNA helicase [Candidatus Limnocylindrales bacterium]
MADLKNLNIEQRKAVLHGEGPLLIIAGAGTGKTTVITTRIQNLILEKKVPPSSILALTFTEKAAAEMETRVDQILPYGYSQLWIETFHAFADRVLRQEAIHIGLNPSFDLIREAESLLFLRKHLFEFELDYFRPLGNPMKFLQGMLNHFSRLKDDDINPEQYIKYAQKIRNSKFEIRNEDEDEIKKTLEMANAFKKYEDMKAKQGVMDFSDLISNTLKLFRTRKNILAEYQRMFQYILVDEFQDTNYAQNELAILLAGGKKNITVVGDDDQSIYRWRGAAISNMIQFRSHFPKAEIVTLNKNYRSTQNILDGSYQMIQNNNPDRLEIKEKIDKKLISQREIKGEEIEFIYTQKAADEAEEVAKKIQELAKKSSLKYNDFAILVRANDHSTPFLRSLERRRIPYQFLGPGHLFQQNEIKDLISYLHALANFEDTASLYRVITLEIFEIVARDVAAVLNFSKKNNFSLFEAMEQVDDSAVTQEGKEKITRIVEMIKRHLEKIPKETAGQILYYFFEDSGLLGHYLDPRSVRTEKEAQNIAKFFEKLQNFAANRDDASVFVVVDWIDLSMELGESPLAADIDWTQNNAVNILTIHSSKGLEFPVVFVVNLVTQRFPSRDRKEQIPVPDDLIKEVLPTGNESIQEERRLFYVATTRAKDKLYLTASKFYGEGKRERKLSPFIFETLGEALIKKITEKQTIKSPGQQLSLLEIVNANVQLQESNNNLKIEQSLNTKTPVTYISYSQLQTFKTCPLHYKLRYILNFPSPAAPALSYGISVHSSLRDILLAKKAGENVTEEYIKSTLKANWINEGYSGKTHEQKTYTQAEKILSVFWENYKKEKPDTIGIETPFNFWINKVKAGGRIDRVDKLEGNNIEIVDYKTGKNMLDEKKAKDDLQLSFYALAATEVHDQVFGKKPDEIKLTLHYLEANQKVSTTRSKEELEMAKEKISEIVSEIENSDFQCNGGMRCKDCEYKILCETSN